MPKLTRNLFLLGQAIFATMGFIILATTYDTNHYLAAASDKHHRLYASKPPRIILVGGSNLAFSVDSEKIERRFGMPVINMGLHAGVELRFMLSEIQPVLSKGDVVIIFPEYEHFYSLLLDGRPRELGNVIKFCPECISAINTPGQAFNVISGILQTLEGDILRGVRKTDSYEKVYTCAGFNEWGDMVAHLDQPDPGDPNKHVSRFDVNSLAPTIDLLNSFYRSCESANIRVLLMFPAIPINEYKSGKKNFMDLYDHLNADLKIPIIGTPGDFAYPRDMFYDTVYHMNRIGRDSRTAHVIDLLTPVFEKGK